MFCKPTTFSQFRWSHFWENRNFIIFPMWTSLKFKGRSKTKIMARNIYKRILYIELTRLMSWFRPCVRRRKKLKNIYPASGIFPGKFASIKLLGFECTINPQNLIKVVGAIFEKIKFFYIFLMWTTLNFRVRVKTNKKCSRYLREDPRYRFWTRLMS